MLRFFPLFLVWSTFSASCHGGLTLRSDVQIDEYEQSNYEAIAKIHSHLDDDRNGEVDFTESNEFIRDELKDNNRKNMFHNNDAQITVVELWKSWVHSEVHNWTTPQVVAWLVDYVHLPQYTEMFTKSKINGTVLPRLAANQFNGVFGKITDAKHKKKISLRAMDVILFGAPAGHNFIKDIVMAFSVVVATAGCWYALHQKRRAKKQMEQMMKDLVVLQQAEQNFGDLQDRLIQAEEEHQRAIQEKTDLEMRLEEEIKSSKFGAEKWQDAQESTKEQMQMLEDAQQELSRVRKALLKAEKALEFQSWKAPSALREWLQMTYTKETKQYHVKRAQALKQMADAKEACDRIRKKRNSLIGSFRMAHDMTIDEVDQFIIKARASLAEVTNELQERQHRWSQIELLCGFNIVSDVKTSNQSDTLVASSSNVAQALVNVADIGSVGSGRKISDTSSPNAHDNNLDPPPTYSSVAVQNSPNLSDSRPLRDILEPINVSSQHQNTTERDEIAKNLSLFNGHHCNGDHNGLDQPCLINNGTLGSFSGSKLSPTTNKTKNKWFGSKKDIDLVETDAEEETRRKKIKWLWKSAALKSTVKNKELLGKEKSSIN